MFDKELLKLIGGNKKYVVYTVLLMVLGMLANIGITASICWAVYFLIEGYEPLAYIYPAITAVVAIIVRYIASRLTSSPTTLNLTIAERSLTALYPCATSCDERGVPHLGQ